MADPTTAPPMPPLSIPIGKRLSNLFKNIRNKFRRLFGVRVADSVPTEIRDICDRYGEQVISTMLAGGFQPGAHELRRIFYQEDTRDHARDWLTEASDVREYKERWVSGRDLILEIVVIALIGWEIHIGYKQESQQAKNFSDQQTVLTNLQTSSQATATTLTALKNTTEIMSKNVERNAQAAESSSETAAKSLVVSERAYVTTASSSAEPKANEKLKITSTCTNSGKTPAIHVRGRSWMGAVGKEETAAEAYTQIAALAGSDETTLSHMMLGPSQSTQQTLESRNEMPEAEVNSINRGDLALYVFVEVRYEDTFGRHHTTLSCNRYSPERKTLVLCNALNKAD
jgi:hypothetical protein